MSETAAPAKKKPPSAKAGCGCMSVLVILFVIMAIAVDPSEKQTATTSPEPAASPSTSANTDAEPTEWVALDNIKPPAHLSLAQSALFAEATGLLKDRCQQLAGSNLCFDRADQFVREYVNAVAGDYTAQENVAQAFNSGDLVDRDMTAVCAFRQLMAASHDRRYDHSQRVLTTTYCIVTHPEVADISPDAQALASHLQHIRAETHLKRIPVPELFFDPAKQREENPPG